MQVYAMTKIGLQQGFVPYVGTGKVEWDNVHIHDLSNLFVSLVDAALDAKTNTDPEIFGPRAYFFAEAATHTWGDVARWIAEAAHQQGYFKEPTTKSITMDWVLSVDGASKSWATNSKSIATRARKYFGWNPVGRSLKEEIPYIVAAEAKLLGLSPSQ